MKGDAKKAWVFAPVSENVDAREEVELRPPIEEDEEYSGSERGEPGQLLKSVIGGESWPWVVID